MTPHYELIENSEETSVNPCWKFFCGFITLIAMIGIIIAASFGVGYFFHGPYDINQTIHIQSFQFVAVGFLVIIFLWLTVYAYFYAYKKLLKTENGVNKMFMMVFINISVLLLIPPYYIGNITPTFGVHSILLMTIIYYPLFLWGFVGTCTLLVKLKKFVVDNLFNSDIESH
jgi:hypothetical protein